MPIVIDPTALLIRITSPTTTVDAQTLHDAVEDFMATPEGLLYADILQPEGKIEDPTNPGVFSQIILVLSTLWQIQFWGGSGYTRIYGGKLVGGVSDQPIKATGTAGDITVLESPVDGLTVVSGSGVTPQDKTDIVDGVWQANTKMHAATASSTAESLQATHDFAIGAHMLQASSSTIIFDTVASGFAETTTEFKGGGTATLSSEDDNYVGRTVIFKAGTIGGQASRVTAYNASSNVFSVIAMTSPPADGNPYIII